MDNCFPIRAELSSAKVEKVVKPPQKPLTMNNQPLPSSHAIRLPRPKSKPMSRQPEIFTINVPKGKSPCVVLLMR